MKKFILPMVLGSMLLALPAVAQQTGPRSLPIDGAAPEPALAVGIDGAFLLPIGNFGDAANPLIGALLRLEYPLALNVNFAARAGYLFGLMKDQGAGIETGADMIPILAGIRYFPVGGPGTGGGFYLHPEFGVNVIRSKISLGGSRSTDTDVYAALGLGLGFQAGMFQAGSQLFIADIGSAKDSLGVLFTAGVTF